MSQPAKGDRTRLALLLLIIVEITLRLSPWAVAFSLALGGLVVLDKRRRLYALAALMTLMLARLGGIGSGELRFSLGSVHEGRVSTARLLNRIVPERDIVIPATAAIAITGAVPEGGLELLGATIDGYERMQADVGDAASPIASTFRNGQGETRDLLSYRVAAPRFVAVFLHGYAGNFALPCWQVAVAVRDAGGSTYCPSTSFEGAWWRDRATVAETITLAREQEHVDHVVLIGLSNGAIGASRLAPRLRRRLDALVLISGSSGARPPRGLPIYGVYGRADPMSRPLRRYLRAARARGHAVDGGHFALLTRHREVRDALVAYLKRRARGWHASRGPLEVLAAVAPNAGDDDLNRPLAERRDSISAQDDREVVDDRLRSGFDQFVL